MSSKSVSVGDKVILQKNREGIIRFKGELPGKDGTFYGVELTKGKGKHDGKYNEKQYFQCKSGKGIFVTQKQIIFQINKNMNSPSQKPKGARQRRNSVPVKPSKWEAPSWTNDVLTLTNDGSGFLDDKQAHRGKLIDPKSLYGKAGYLPAAKFRRFSDKELQSCDKNQLLNYIKRLQNENDSLKKQLKNKKNVSPLNSPTQVPNKMNASQQSKLSLYGSKSLSHLHISRNSTKTKNENHLEKTDVVEINSEGFDSESSHGSAHECKCKLILQENKTLKIKYETLEMKMNDLKEEIVELDELKQQNVSMAQQIVQLSSRTSTLEQKRNELLAQLYECKIQDEQMEGGASNNNGLSLDLEEPTNTNEADIDQHKQKDIAGVTREYLHLTAAVVKMKYPRLHFVTSEELIENARNLNFWEYHDIMVMTMEHLNIMHQANDLANEDKVTEKIVDPNEETDWVLKNLKKIKMRTPSKENVTQLFLNAKTKINNVPKPKMNAPQFKVDKSKRFPKFNMNKLKLKLASKSNSKPKINL